jgi:hypothetical protein
VPTARAVALSGPEYVDVQLANPESASVPFHVIATGCLYQPFVSGERLTVAPVICGGVESYFRANEDPVAEFPALS